MYLVLHIVMVICLQKLKTTVKKSEQLQGPTKSKKITVKDFKNENKFKKSVKE